MSQENQNIDYRSTLNVARVHSAAARENPDLTAESKPASLWVIVATAGVALFGGSYFGASMARGYTKYEPEVPAYEGAQAAGQVDDFAEGGKIFKNNCASCHQPNGLGVPGQYPPLDGSEWVSGSDERLAVLILYGLSGPITVKGQAYSGAAQMPAHQAILTDKKVAQVMTYIRGAWSNKSPNVAAEGVAELKKRTGPRQTATTEPELKAISDDKMLLKPPPPPAPAAPGAAPAPTAK